MRTAAEIRLYYRAEEKYWKEGGWLSRSGALRKYFEDRCSGVLTETARRSLYYRRTESDGGTIDTYCRDFRLATQRGALHVYGFDIGPSENLSRLSLLTADHASGPWNPAPEHYWSPADPDQRRYRHPCLVILKTLEWRQRTRHDIIGDFDHLIPPIFGVREVMAALDDA